MNSAGIYTVSSFTQTGNQTIDGLLRGVKWAQPQITYAFPDSADDFASNYLGTMPELFVNTTAQTQAMATAILDKNDGNVFNNAYSVEGFTNLNVVIGDHATALIRVSMAEVITDISGETDARALSGGVSDSPYFKTKAGDVWLAERTAHVSNDMNKNPIPGNRDYQVLLHEIGHSLGLKHGHADDYGWPTLPADKMGHGWSVMSYNAAPGYASQTAFNLPQSYMLADILALQTLYGANYSTNSTDTVYTWNGDDSFVNGGLAIDGTGGYAWSTIWDGGGVDTYDFSNVTQDAYLTVQAGEYSTFGPKAFQFYDSATMTWVYAPGNVANAYRFEGSAESLIENIIAGSGNDTLAGNQADNVLTGGAGNDLFMFKNKWGVDTILDFTDGEDLISVEKKNNEPTIQQLLDSAYTHANKVVIEWMDSKIKLQGFDIANLDASDFV